MASSDDCNAHGLEDPVTSLPSQGLSGPVVQFVEGGLNVISVMEELTAEIQKYCSKPHRLLLLKGSALQGM